MSSGTHPKHRPLLPPGFREARAPNPNSNRPVYEDTGLGQCAHDRYPTNWHSGTVPEPLTIDPLLGSWLSQSLPPSITRRTPTTRSSQTPNPSGT